MRPRYPEHWGWYCSKCGRQQIWFMDTLLCLKCNKMTWYALLDYRDWMKMDKNKNKKEVNKMLYETTCKKSCVGCPNYNPELHGCILFEALIQKGCIKESKCCDGECKK